MEIERKFIVPSLFDLPEPSETIRIVQAYLKADGESVVRVRIAGQKAYLTVKGKSSEDGLQREEFEYEIPVSDAERMLPLCSGGRIEKERLIIMVKKDRWEVDVFYGRHRGLVLAEIELSRPDQHVDLPGWVGREVTGDKRFYNAYLANHDL